VDSASPPVPTQVQARDRCAPDDDLMDTQEALRLLDETLDRFRREPYESLTARIGADPLVKELRGDSGQSYQIGSSGTTGLTVTCRS